LLIATVSKASGLQTQHSP